MSDAERDLLWLDACELHDLGPFLCIIRDELAELSWRASIHNTAKSDKRAFTWGSA
jgi:hypothetical protein